MADFTSSKHDQNETTRSSEEHEPSQAAASVTQDEAGPTASPLTPSASNDKSASPTLHASENYEKHSSDLETNNGTANELHLSSLRKVMILCILSCAQFFDIYIAVTATVALPEMGRDLGFHESDLQWVVSGYTLTFSAFMLISGRLADIYHPKPIFVAGFLLVGLMSIPVAASVNPIMTIVFRAVQGIGAAMNTPTAVAMVRIAFQDPGERNIAYAVYGAFGALGNAVGFVVGGALTTRASWRWVFYILAIIIVPFAVSSWFILPSHIEESEAKSGQRQSLDWPGVLTLTIGLILFVFAISSGGAVPWGSVRVILPLVISVILMFGFLLIERVVKDPAVPPRTWTNKNFIPLFIYGLSVYWYFLSISLLLVEVLQTVFHMSAFETALRCMPLGIAAGISAYLTGYIAHIIPRAHLLILGEVVMLGGALLFAFADTPDRYWSMIFPGMILGMCGVSFSYVGCTITVMEGARKGEEGVLGALMYTSYQMGSTIGLAIVSSIAIAVNRGFEMGSMERHRGYAASFFSLVGLNGVMIVIVLVFVKKP